MGAATLMASTAASVAAADEPDATVQACTFSQADQDWIDRSLDARRAMAAVIGTDAFASPAAMIIFDAACVRQSADALRGEAATWTAQAHQGQITLPDGAAIPAGVTSFAGESRAGAFYIMSTPSVWRAAGVPGGATGLENLMTAVLLHESAHVAQFASYMRSVGLIAERNRLPEDFGDDSIQQRFKSDPIFAASINRETALLYAAAAAKSDREALRLAREARDLIAARRARAFTGADAYLAEAEDLFLALEGSGQWVGYQWLTMPNGGGMTQAEALSGFGRRGGWWTQDEGLALVLATERIGGTGWRMEAFGEGKVAGAAMLDAALRHRRRR